MRYDFWLRSSLGALILSGCFLDVAVGQPIKPEDINKAGPGNSRAAVTKLQVLLDRAGYSPGVIDGRMGENVKNALIAFQTQKGIGVSSGRVDDHTWKMITERAPEKIIIDYQVSEDDVSGPFTKNIPEEFEKKKELDRLGFARVSELLAEKFHMDEEFLKELNPGADFTKARTRIRVTNVKQGEPKPPRANRVVVDKGKKQVRAYSEKGELLAAFPATVGSEERPAPSGTLTVKAVAENPTYTYDPSLKFDGVSADKAFTIAPGPNNPVGIIWIELSKEGYGIHGTPEPAHIGKTASHGCVRLTNWDAKSLGRMVTAGIKIEFMD